MSTLKKIRENVGLVIVLIAISLFAFIFTDLFNSLGSTNDNSVAEINGSTVDYQELDRKVNFVERNSNRVFENSDEQWEMRNQAWQSFVQEAVYQKEWQSTGIGMTDQELKYMLTGRIYHPYVASSGYFTDSLGNYNPAIVDQVLAQADQFNLADPNLPDNIRRYKQGLLDLLDILRLDRRSNKWQRLIANSAFVTDNEVLVANVDNQRTANISYVAVPYATVSDSAVSVTESDYSNYYEKNRSKYKRGEEYAQLKYTYFPIQPSAKDSAETRSNLNKIVNDFANAGSAFEYAFSNTDARSIDTTLRAVSALPGVVLPYRNQTDTVIGPLLDENGLNLFRVAKIGVDSFNASLKLRHILVNLPPTASSEDSATARQKAESIRSRVNSGNFAELAAAESDDALTKDKGGEMGWVGTSDLGADFEDVMKDATPGSFKVARTENGFHVLEVLDRDENLYALAQVLRTITPGTETQDSVFKRASGYMSKVQGGLGFDEVLNDYAEARTNTSPNFGPATVKLAGLFGARPVVAWTFNHDQGNMNEEVIETDNAYVIARIEAKGKKGFRSLEEVKAEIEPEVRRLAKARYIAGKLASAGGGDLTAIATAYGGGASSGQATGLRFTSNDVQGIGTEPKVVGRAFGLEAGAVSKPIIGNSGVYVIKADGFTEATPLDDVVKEFQKQTLRQTKSNDAVNASYQGMIDIADVEDRRYKFEKQ